MVVASALMGIGTDEFVKLFEVVIQLGAILAVVVLYFKRFVRSVDFYIKLVIAVIPAVILGLLLKKYIDKLLESPLVVAVAFVVGGIILLFVDDWFNRPVIKEEKNISYLTGFKIGVFQCLAMIRCFPFSSIYCGWYVAKIKPDSLSRILVLFGCTHYVWGYGKGFVGF